MNKQCFKCKLSKPLDEFYKHPQMPDGHVNKCKECNKVDVMENYSVTREEKNKYDKYRQRNSFTRIFNHRYSGIKHRCSKTKKDGRVQKSVYGKKFLSKEEWNEWCYADENFKQFMNIYNNWVQNGFPKSLSPSIDRINNKKGYTYTNLQWLSQSENCKKYNN